MESIESPKRVVRHSMIAAKRIQREGVSRSTVAEDVAHYLRFGVDHPRVERNDTMRYDAIRRGYRISYNIGTRGRRRREDRGPRRARDPRPRTGPHGHPAR